MDKNLEQDKKFRQQQNIDKRKAAIEAIKKFRKDRGKDNLMTSEEIVELVREGRKY